MLAVASGITASAAVVVLEDALLDSDYYNKFPTDKCGLIAGIEQNWERIVKYTEQEGGRFGE